MPTYDYHCEACGRDYEMFQAITAKPVKKCPHCGKSKARRLIGAGGGIIFRGSGFYCNDYRDNGSGPSKGKASAPESASKPEKSKSAPPESGGGKDKAGPAKDAQSH
jgi:putative FmdB family regulatory protein